MWNNIRILSLIKGNVMLIGRPLVGPFNVSSRDWSYNNIRCIARIFRRCYLLVQQLEFYFTWHLLTTLAQGNFKFSLVAHVREKFSTLWKKHHILCKHSCWTCQNPSDFATSLVTLRITDWANVVHKIYNLLAYNATFCYQSHSPLWRGSTP